MHTRREFWRAAVTEVWVWAHPSARRAYAVFVAITGLSLLALAAIAWKHRALAGVIILVLLIVGLADGAFRAWRTSESRIDRGAQRTAELEADKLAIADRNVQIKRRATQRDQVHYLLTELAVLYDVEWRILHGTRPSDEEIRAVAEGLDSRSRAFLRPIDHAWAQRFENEGIDVSTRERALDSIVRRRGILLAWIEDPSYWRTVEGDGTE